MEVTRINAPVKGWNTISPVREMTQDFAVRLENVWFDNAAAANRRPGQLTADNAAPSAGTIGSLHEHYSISGISSIYAWCSDTNLYTISAGTWSAVAAMAAVFATKPRSAQMGNVLLMGNGVAVRTYNGAAWATPAGVSPMSAFCVYNGRMYGTGNPADIGLVYYSNPITGTGATDWTVGGGGGFISAYGALNEGENIVALAEYQGYLVAFGSNSIIFYQGTDPNNPTTFRVAKTIKGIGCFSADSVQGIGNDLIFLSNYGFKSLKEVMVRGDAAAFETSFAINNYIAENIRTGNITNVSSTFAESFGVYLCTFGSETLAYHTLFNSWSSWNGVQPILFTTKAGLTYTANSRLHRISSTTYADYLNGDSVGVPMSFVWETAPFRSGGQEIKSRWNRIELLYEGSIGDTVSVSTWTDLNNSYATSDILTLAPDLPPTAANSLLWTGTATTNPRNAWGTATTGPAWAGSSSGASSGDESLPVVGRGELFSVRIENTNKTPFKLIALETYYNQGNLRK